ncbi:MAG TPA: hypothetical protein VNJ04_16070 [Gemmatimonadaceae bacterium]|nr:hypothetical protein [Gemmatimonadaceae bacterium]
MAATPDDIARVVAAACSAAGPVGNNPGAWKGKVNDLIPEIAAMMSDHSHQWKQAEAILDADHVSCVYLSYELEETSQRLIVGIMADNAQEMETMRTPPMYTPAGRRMRERLDKVQRGDRMHIWKVVEATRRDPTKKVRYIGHFEHFGPPKTADVNSPDVQRAPPSQQSAAAGSAGADLVDALNSLSTTAKLAVRAGAIGLGVANFLQPANDEEYNTIMNLIERHRADS